MKEINFIPRGELVLLEVDVIRKTPNGLDLPEQSWKIGLGKPLRVAAVGPSVEEFKVGDTILLDFTPSGTIKDMLLDIPGAKKNYIIVSQNFIAGKLV